MGITANVAWLLGGLSFSGWGVACLVCGVVLMVVEMLTPGFGLPGIGGALLLITGVALVSSSWVQGLVLGAAILLVLLAIFFVILLLGSRGILDRSPLILRSRAEKAQGYVPSAVPQLPLGEKGKAITPLRPAGIAMFDARRVDVVTQGEFVEPGTCVQVIETAGNTVVVAAVKKQ